MRLPRPRQAPSGRLGWRRRRTSRRTSPQHRRTNLAKTRTRPLAVAITGGIGAGKSEALAAFHRQGAAVISSDEIVHRLLREDQEIRGALLERFGEGILDEAGQIDRKAVASTVFSDRRALAWLEALLHPRVVAEYLAWRERLARLPDPPALCVTEVPLLYEVGGETRFDAVVMITAPADLRAERRRPPVDYRDERLLPDAEKMRRADFPYVNDGSLAELEVFVATVVDRLRSDG